MKAQISLSSKQFPSFNWRQALCVIALFILSALCAKAQNGHCNCSVSSFTAITVYDIAQPGTNFGFGMEAGRWNKEASRFSYFIGTKMQWEGLTYTSGKINENNGDLTRFTLYVKGQVRIINKLYLVVSPGVVNLSSFETGLGLRYTFPIGKVIGIGLEPTYLMAQRQFALNTNVHFCL